MIRPLVWRWPAQAFQDPRFLATMESWLEVKEGKAEEVE
jgi:hypothetical protein